jgi:hypothetical protein
MFVLLDNMEEHVTSPLKEEVMRNSPSWKERYEGQFPNISEFVEEAYSSKNGTPDTKQFEASPRGRANSKSRTITKKNNGKIDTDSPIKRFGKHARSAALVKESKKLLLKWLDEINDNYSHYNDPLTLKEMVKSKVHLLNYRNI